MKLNEQGLRLLKSFEALELEAYPDPGSALGKACTARNLMMRGYRKIQNWQKLDGSPWTIGWGMTGPDVRQGMVITLQQAEDGLARRLDPFEEAVEKLVNYPVTDDEFSALVCFAYNIGVTRFSTSTLLKKLNAKDIDGAAAEFERWDRSGGVVMKGLQARCLAEKALFLSDMPVLDEILTARGA